MPSSTTADLPWARRNGGRRFDSPVGEFFVRRFRERGFAKIAASIKNRRLNQSPRLRSI